MQDKIKLIRASINSGYALFLIVALSFGIFTRPFEVTCPLDKGTGMITGTMGLDVTNVGAQLLSSRSFEMACATIWYEFTYDVQVTLSNKSTTPGIGTVMVKFYDPTAIGRIYPSLLAAIQAKSVEAETVEETTLILTVETSTDGTVVTPIMSQRATKLLFFTVPANETKTIEAQVTIMGWDWVEKSHIVTAGLVNQTVCPYCQGTGKLPITEWLKIKAGIY